MNVTGSIQSEIVVKLWTSNFFLFFAEVTTCFGAPFKE